MKYNTFLHFTPIHTCVSERKFLIIFLSFGIISMYSCQIWWMNRSIEYASLLATPLLSLRALI